MKSTLRLFLLLAILKTSPASAWLSPWIGTCYDARGIPVQTVLRPNQLDLAFASRDPQGVPRTLLSPTIAFYSQAVRDFIWLHECGHHSFDHHGKLAAGIPYTVEFEDQADSWAVRKMIGSRAYTPQQLVEVITFFAGQPGDVQHRDGRLRALFFGANACVYELLMAASRAA